MTWQETKNETNTNNLNIPNLDFLKNPEKFDQYVWMVKEWFRWNSEIKQFLENKILELYQNNTILSNISVISLYLNIYFDIDVKTLSQDELICNENIINSLKNVVVSKLTDYIKKLKQSIWTSIEWFDQSNIVELINEKIDWINNSKNIPTNLKVWFFSDLIRNIDNIWDISKQDIQNLREKRESRTCWFESWKQDGFYLEMILKSNLLSQVDIKTTLLHRCFDDETIQIDTREFHKKSFENFISKRDELDNKYWIDTKQIFNENIDLELDNKSKENFLLLRLWNLLWLNSDEKISIFNTPRDIIKQINWEQVDVRQLFQEYFNLFSDFQSNQIDKFENPKSKLLNWKNYIDKIFDDDNIYDLNIQDDDISSNIEKCETADIILLWNQISTIAPILDIYWWYKDLVDWIDWIDENWKKMNEFNQVLYIMFWTIWIVPWFWVMSKLWKLKKIEKIVSLWTKLFEEIWQRILDWKIVVEWVFSKLLENIWKIWFFRDLMNKTWLNKIIEIWDWKNVRQIDVYLKENIARRLSNSQETKIKIEDVQKIWFSDLRTLFKERIETAEELLGKQLSELQIRSLVKAHLVWNIEDGFTQWEKNRKLLILIRDWKFSSEDALKLTDYGICWVKSKTDAKRWLDAISNKVWTSIDLAKFLQDWRNRFFSWFWFQINNKWDVELLYSLPKLRANLQKVFPDFLDIWVVRSLVEIQLYVKCIDIDNIKKLFSENPSSVWTVRENISKMSDFLISNREQLCRLLWNEQCLSLFKWLNERIRLILNDSVLWKNFNDDFRNLVFWSFDESIKFVESRSSDKLELRWRAPTIIRLLDNPNQIEFLDWMQRFEDLIRFNIFNAISVSWVDNITRNEKQINDLIDFISQNKNNIINSSSLNSNRFKDLIWSFMWQLNKIYDSLPDWNSVKNRIWKHINQTLIPIYKELIWKTKRDQDIVDDYISNWNLSSENLNELSRWWTILADNIWNVGNRIWGINSWESEINWWDAVVDWIWQVYEYIPHLDTKIFRRLSSMDQISVKDSLELLWKILWSIENKEILNWNIYTRLNVLNANLLDIFDNIFWHIQKKNMSLEELNNLSTQMNFLKDRLKQYFDMFTRNYPNNNSVCLQIKSISQSIDNKIEIIIKRLEDLKSK